MPTLAQCLAAEAARREACRTHHCRGVTRGLLMVVEPILPDEMAVALVRLEWAEEAQGDANDE